MHKVLWLIAHSIYHDSGAGPACN